MIKKHPKALPFLFLSEMWERFGYYLVIGIFTLYLKDAVGGFGMTEAEASDLYGTFIGFVFLTPFIGGLLADRVLGYRLSVIIGGILMSCGYFFLSIHSLPMLYAGMICVIVGNGFFKPNISTIVGNLYNSEEYRSKKDAGYTIFYMGINIGAFVCNFFGAAFFNVYGWSAAFFSAGAGMLLGLVFFLVGMKHFKHTDTKKEKVEGELSLSRIVYFILLPALLFGIMGYFLPFPLAGSHSTDAFLLACIPIIAFYVSLYRRASLAEKKPLAVMLAIFPVVISFWMVFKQNGSTLNTWVQNYTDREIPKTILPLMESMHLVDTIYYSKRKIVETDQQFRIIHKDSEIISYPDYFKNIQKSTLPKDGEKLSLVNTNIFQSVNPFWVLVLGPLILALMASLRRKGKEPSTPLKMAIGLLICSLSCIVMTGAVYSSGNGLEKSSAWWFVGSYTVFTIGELLLSPIGLSMVSKLSPPRLTSVMMGAWFLANSIGNKLSGLMSSFWDSYEDKANFFWINTLLLLFAAIILFVMLRWLNKVFKEYA